MAGYQNYVYIRCGEADYISHSINYLAFLTWFYVASASSSQVEQPCVPMRLDITWIENSPSSLTSWKSNKRLGHNYTSYPKLENRSNYRPQHFSKTRRLKCNCAREVNVQSTLNTRTPALCAKQHPTFLYLYALRNPSPWCDSLLNGFVGLPDILAQ